jgi:hypothetical protein
MAGMTDEKKSSPEPRDKKPAPVQPEVKRPPGTNLPKEIGGPKGPEPTRYGDWEVNGRVSDF